MQKKRHFQFCNQFYLFNNNKNLFTMKVSNGQTKAIKDLQIHAKKINFSNFANYLVHSINVKI